MADENNQRNFGEMIFLLNHGIELFFGGKLLQIAKQLRQQHQPTNRHGENSKEIRIHSEMTLNAQGR